MSAKSTVNPHTWHLVAAAAAILVVLVLAIRVFSPGTTNQTTSLPEASSEGEWDNSDPTLAALAASLGLPQVTSDQQAEAMAKDGHTPIDFQAELAAHPNESVPTGMFRASQMYEYGQEKNLDALAEMGAYIDLTLAPDGTATFDMFGRSFTGTYDDSYLYIDSVDGEPTEQPIKFVYLWDGTELISGSHWVEIHLFPLAVN